MSDVMGERAPLLKKLNLPSNWSKQDLGRFALAFWLEVQIGMIESSLGSLLGSIQESYDISYSAVSFISLADAVSRFAGCVSGPFIVHRVGFQWTLMIASTVLVLSYIAVSTLPPFPLVICGLALSGLGSGVVQQAVATYIAHFHEGPLMSLVYAGEGLGALVQPFIVTDMMESSIGWNNYFYVPLGMSLMNFPLAWLLFHGYEPPEDEEDAPEGAVRRWLKAALTATVIYGAVLQILAYSAEDCISTWIVLFMADARSGKESLMQSVLAGFWAGTTLGRTFLAHATHKMGVRLALTVYFVLGITSMIVLQFVKNIIGDAIAVAIFGFFLGPSVPTILSVTSDSVSASLVSPANSVLMSAGVVGSGLAPVLIGFINSSGGLPYFPATMMGVVMATIVVWQLSFKSRKLQSSDE